MCYDAAYLRFFVDDEEAEPPPSQRKENIDSLRASYSYFAHYNVVWSCVIVCM
jgi:hypothetical protein